MVNQYQYPNVVPISGLPASSPPEVASITALLCCHSGRESVSAHSTRQLACGSATEISPTNVDTFQKSYPDLLGKQLTLQIRIIHGLHVYGALLNDGTIRAGEELIMDPM